MDLLKAFDTIEHSKMLASVVPRLILYTQHLVFHMVPYWALYFLLFISMICPSALRFVKCLCTQMIPFCFVPDLTLKSSKTI